MARSRVEEDDPFEFTWYLLERGEQDFIVLKICFVLNISDCDDIVLETPKNIPSGDVSMSYSDVILLPGEYRVSLVAVSDDVYSQESNYLIIKKGL